jgi:DNA-binding beta-propeller fold protein YncE
MIVVLAGCGPMVAADGSESGSTSGADSGDEVTTNATVTVSSSVGDTGAIDPPFECPTPGACEGNCAQWEAEYRSPSAGKGQLGGVAIAPDGTIVVAGMADSDDVVLVGYDGTGEILWEETPLGTGDGAEDMPWRIAIGADGSVAIAGQRNVPGLPSSWLVLDARDIEEQSSFDLGAASYVSALFHAADGSLLVGGGNDSGTPFMSKFSASGAFLQALDDDLGLERGALLGGVATSPSTIVLVGMQGEEDDVWLASYDLENGVQWSTTSDGDPSTKQWASDVAVLPDGDLLVVGAQRDEASNALGWAGRFAADGEARWARTYPGTGCCANVLDHVEVSTDGRIFVLGVRGDGLLYSKLQELDCNGEIVWEWNHESPSGGSAFPSGLAWSPDTGLVAVGTDYVSEADARGFVSRLSP